MFPMIRPILFAAFVLSGCAAWAHVGGCHFHGKKKADEATVKICANERKTALLDAGKIDASWKAVEPSSIKLGPGEKGDEWRVVYENPTIVNPSRQRIFMFFTPQGNFVAANHSGR